MARSFDGIDDVLTLSIGAVGGTAWDAMTIAAIVRPTSDGVSKAICNLGNSASRPSLVVNSSDVFLFRYNGVELTAPTIRVKVADGWVLFVACRAAGTVACRFHKYVYSTGVWTHEDDNATRAADTGVPVTSNVIGARASIFWPGDIAVVGAWRGTKLSDAEIEGIDLSLQAWLDLTPTALWALDQASTATAVEDLTTGNADQTALVGTTVSATDPAGFDYTLGGVVAVPRLSPYNQLLAQ